MVVFGEHSRRSITVFQYAAGLGRPAELPGSNRVRQHSRGAERQTLHGRGTNRNPLIPRFLQ